MALTREYRHCNQYFQFTHMDGYEKVTFASLHFRGWADHWYQFYQMGRYGSRWLRSLKMFALVLKSCHKDKVVEFDKLQQIGSISDCQDKFEEFKGVNAWGELKFTSSFRFNLLERP